jgi:hypothetical protein
MKKLITTFIALVALAALAGPLFAEGEKKVTSAEELLGMRIVSPAGEEIGEIKDIKLESGEVAFIILDESKLDNVPQQAKSADEFQRALESQYGTSPAWEHETDN